MALTGKLGPYRVERQLGGRSSSVVYLVRDPRGHRAVTLTPFSREFADRPDQLARVKRESERLAALDHPNLATNLGVEEYDGARYLVQEYVDGETLEQRLRHGPLPVDDAVEICRQIAAGVETAHEAGVIHRDLNPRNVVLAREGPLKVLDFGLSHGSPAYMSPEQARERPVDRRTDIWSFGCMLYECLVGTHPLPGDTQQGQLAAILEREPNWSALPERTPSRVRELLERCLVKDQKQRLRDIGDARIELEEALREQEWSEAGLPNVGQRFPLLPLTLLAIAGILIGAVVSLVPRPERPAVTSSMERFTVELPDGVRLALAGGLGSIETMLQGAWPPDQNTLAVSPDGSVLAFAGYSDEGQRIYVRRMNEFRAHPLAGSEGGWGTPMFSPDGEWIAFLISGRGLVKLPVSGGEPVTVAVDLPSSSNPHGCWAGETIIMGATNIPLYEIPEDGGEWSPLTEVQPGEVGHSQPHCFPDGNSVLFTAHRETPRIEALELDRGRREIIVENGSNPIYLRSGHLAYTVGSGLYAVSYDAAARKVTGSPVSIGSELLTHSLYPTAQLAASRNGTLVYVEDLDFDRSLLRVERDGSARPLSVEKHEFISVDVSHDGRLLAVSFVDPEPRVAIAELARPAFVELSLGVEAGIPVHSSDGKTIFLTARRNGGWDLYRFGRDAGNLQPLTNGTEWARWPVVCSPDGRWLVFNRFVPDKTWFDIEIFDLENNAIRPFRATEDPLERAYSLSPDGQWIAYTAGAGPQVFIEAFPDGGGRTRISTDSGEQPLWSRDGGELYFVDKRHDRLLVVNIETEPKLRVGTPRVFFENLWKSWGFRPYTEAPDGSIIMIGPEAPPTPSRIHVVRNWTDELHRRVRATRTRR